ncbi:hypothetical protein M1555_05050 [Patescibacteria group bacterium]|nr:hypothetical protein [Patescibacteria group bacterium]
MRQTIAGFLTAGFFGVIVLGGAYGLGKKSPSVPLTTFATGGSDVKGSRGFPIPTPTAVPTPEIFHQNVHSPDGTKQIMLTRISRGNGSATYEVGDADISGKDAVVLYTASVPVAARLSLPPNSWSPDNSYVYIYASESAVLVYRADGKPFPGGETARDVTADFHDKVSGKALRDVTGWDDAELLHVFTSLPDGSRSNPYWYDVVSRTFTGLPR